MRLKPIVDASFSLLSFRKENNNKKLLSKVAFNDTNFARFCTSCVCNNTRIHANHNGKKHKSTYYAD